MPNGTTNNSGTTFSNIIQESVNAFREIWTTIRLTPSGSMQVLPPPTSQPSGTFRQPSGLETVAKYALIAGLLIMGIAIVLWLAKKGRR